MPAIEVARCSDPETSAGLESAIVSLLERDLDLFLTDVHERTVAARLALYLQDEFADWHVDCEYNRDGHDPKEINLPEGITRPYPDIIVHRRRQGEPGANLLVVELKLSSNPHLSRELRDIAKLPAYIDSLGYRHAVFVKIATWPDAPALLETRWFAPFTA